MFLYHVKLRPIVPFQGGALPFFVYVVANRKSSIMTVLHLSDEVSVLEGWEIESCEILGKSRLGSPVVFPLAL